MTISNQTEKFIECMRTMQGLYSQIYSALQEIYSSQDVERIIAECFIVEYAALERRVEQLVITSMKEKMSWIDSQEI